MNESTSILDSIATLPPLPNTAHEILRSFGDEFIDADTVANTVEKDPGLSAKLLGLANSSYFGASGQVSDIREAIVRVIGVETVRSLVLAMTMQRSFKNGNCPAFNTEQFWTQSLLTGECCKRMAAADPAVTDVDRSLAYATGLCNNIGLMALAQMQSYRTNFVLLAHNERAKPGNLCELLRAEFETDHVSVTADLARRWSMPEAIVEAYDYRVSPQTSYTGRLGRIVVASAAAVANSEADLEHQSDLRVVAGAAGVTVAELVKMATFGDRQQERVRSLSNTMSG